VKHVVIAEKQNPTNTHGIIVNARNAEKSELKTTTGLIANALSVG
jgi:hypothetical protein